MYTTTLEQQIHQVFEHFIDELSSFPTDLLNKDPKAGNWTIGQLAQHVVLATAGLGDEKTKPVDRPYDQLEDSIRETFLLSKEKFQAPEFINPEKKNYQLQDLLRDLRANHELLISTIHKKDLSVLCLDIELPGWGYLTRFEWLKLIIYHVKRHTMQLEKLKEIQTAHAV